MANTIWPLHFLAHKWLRSFENYPWVRITIKKEESLFVVEGGMHSVSHLSAYTHLTQNLIMWVNVGFNSLNSSLWSLPVRLRDGRDKRGNIPNALQCQAAQGWCSQQNFFVPSPCEAFVLICEKTLQCFLGCGETLITFFGWLVDGCSKKSIPRRQLKTLTPDSVRRTQHK